MAYVPGTYATQAMEANAENAIDEHGMRRSFGGLDVDLAAMLNLLTPSLTTKTRSHRQATMWLPHGFLPVLIKMTC